MRGEGEEFGDAEPDERGDEVAPDECPGLRERGFDGAVAEYSGRALFLFKFFFCFRIFFVGKYVFKYLVFSLRTERYESGLTYEAMILGTPRSMK